MTKFVENVNLYLAHMKIKQTYISIRSGIDAKKISRILSGNQEATISDVEKISRALGKQCEYFLSSDFKLPQNDFFSENVLGDAAARLNQEQKTVFLQIVELIENADELLGAGNRYVTAIGE